jgi:hypothetical protein
MAGLTEFYCGCNVPSHASQFKWLEYTFNSSKCFVTKYLICTQVEHAWDTATSAATGHVGRCLPRKLFLIHRHL